MDRINTLICDLDNTLYDWIAYFVPSFYAMIDELTNITGWDRELVLNDFRSIHQKHGNTEHPFALLELDTVQKEFGDLSKAEIAKIFDPAFLAFNRTRKRTLTCYPDVPETLSLLKERGIKLVAYTDSDLHAVIDRLKRLEISKFFQAFYCRTRSSTEHPEGKDFRQWAGDFPLERVTELPTSKKKPDPTVLRRICSDLEIEPCSVAYVGDSVTRDVYMAEKADVISIWAKYGTYHPEGSYEKLVRVTHWTKEDVKREILQSENAKNVVPDYILENGFGELKDLICA